MMARECNKLRQRRSSEGCSPSHNSANTTCLRRIVRSGRASYYASRGAKGQSNPRLGFSFSFADAELEDREGKAVKSEAHGRSVWKVQ
jgi:hypothetical protein